VGDSAIRCVRKLPRSRGFSAGAIALALALGAASPAPAAGTEPLLGREHSVVIAVEEPDEAAAQLLDLVRRLGGELDRQAGNRITLRVPEAKLGDFVRQARELGRLRHASARSLDMSAARAEVEAELASAIADRRRLEALGRHSGGVSDSLLVERRTAEIEARIAAAQAALAQFERSAGSGHVEVVLEAPRPPERLSPFRLPFPWLDTLSLERLRSAAPEPPGPAPGIDANVDIAFQLEARWLVDRPPGEEGSGAAVLATRFRSAVTDPVGAAVGFDLGLGGLHGFAWELALMGGVGTSFGSVATVGLVAGLGLDGWTGRRVPASLMAPVELFVTADVGEVARALVFWQPRRSLGSEARDDGADRFAFADEWSAGGALLLPWLIGNQELDDGGLRLGFVLGEQLGTRSYAITFGLGWGLVRR
jgi:hypothetical protein